MTPTSTLIELVLSMPADHFSEGDDCQLDLLVTNAGSERESDLYVLLDVFGQYWSYPGWQPLSSGLDHLRWMVPQGHSDTLNLIPEFTMPPVVPAGPFYFYAAMFEAGALDLEHLVSNGAVFEFRLESE